MGRTVNENSQQHSETLAWEACSDDFCYDGSFRDIYITQTTIADWRLLYAMLCNDPTATFEVNGEGVRQPLLANVDEVFRLRDGGTSTLLLLCVDTVCLGIHFFCVEEFECNFLPHEGFSNREFQSVLRFVQTIGDCTGKPVAITPENFSSQPFITYDPATTEFRHHKVNR